MQNKPLHIVCFDNPYPPIYGGVIDAFYMIKAFHELGYDIYLHSFVDIFPTDTSAMDIYVKKAYFYKRKHKYLKFLALSPFSVISRYDKTLLNNIRQIDAPLLFEGLQSTYLLKKCNLGTRRVYLRLLNLEDRYYKGLYHSETNFIKKIALGLEGLKYLRYQKIFSRFNAIFTLSVFETAIVVKQFKNALYVPVFHGNKTVSKLSEMGKFALYHGDLRMADNKRAVLFLINVFRKIPDYPLIIASNHGKDMIENEIRNLPNISHIKIKDGKHLDALLADAHINVMASFQQSGTKLKAINALFKSRFCIINSNMVDDEQIMSVCTIAETESDFINAVNRLKNQLYTDNEKRQAVLENVLNDTANALKMSQQMQS